MIDWRIFHKETTCSTNNDALSGSHGDVFTADFQTAGRGRIGHKWLSTAGMNLAMSAVVDVSSLSLESASTFPLVVGLAVARGLNHFLTRHNALVKWPNDIFVDGRKVAGVLCERHGDNLIAGVGVNVMQREFPEEIASRATSLALFENKAFSVDVVRGAILEELAVCYEKWVSLGFEALYEELSMIDFLKSRAIAVRQTDDDPSPVEGVCGGIQKDGSLDVGGEKVFAGEAHVEEVL